MSLDWDVLLDGISIKDQISQFEVRDSVGGYARELTLNSVDPSFYEQFDIGVLPKLRLEVKVKEDTTWTSLGNFYIEQPGISVDPDNINSDGVWGRSETAKAGSPFAPKVSKSWAYDTTASAIINEMATLVDLTVNFEITDYTVFGGTYSADGVYPIDVINDLASYAGACVGCTADGALAIRPNIFHPDSTDHSVTDFDMISIVETIDYPEFGNRILISPTGSESSYSVTLVILDGTDCMPADGVSTGTVLAFVTDQDGLPANNVSVDWTAESGVTLDKEVTVTGDYLIDKEIVNADNYYKLTVAYQVSSVIGVWKYADSSHQNNLWKPDNENCVFDGNEIVVAEPFTYCDQTLIVSYITSGVASNTVISGNQSFDVAVTADVGGVQSSVDVKLGNSCACGSSLNVSVASSESVCFGKYTQIMAWATINNEAALGYQVNFDCELACGEAYTRTKTLGYVDIYAEIVTVFNVIEGVSQVKTALPIADGYDPPRVYYHTGTGADMYSAHTGQTIDLDTQHDTGTELIVYYTAAGATTTVWYPGRLSMVDALWSDYSANGCTGTVNISMADGTEAGLSTSVDISAVDCTIVMEDDLEIPETDDDDPLPEPDPEPDPYFPIEPVGGLEPDPDWSGDETGDPVAPYPEGGSLGGDGTFPGESTGSVSPAEVSLEGDDGGDGSSESGQPPVSPEPDPNSSSPGGAVDKCGASILNKMSQYDAVVGDSEKAKLRFGVTNSAECTDPPCPCSDMCETEIYEKGNTYDYSKTIHEQALEAGEKNSPAYNEAYNTIKTDNLAECEQKCEDTRSEQCDTDCEISGPAVLTPGESAEYVCSDGTTSLVTMPSGACGTQTFTIGCCEFEIRSTIGNWECSDPLCNGETWCSSSNTAGTKERYYALCLDFGSPHPEYCQPYYGLEPGEPPCLSGACEFTACYKFCQSCEWVCNN